MSSSSPDFPDAVARAVQALCTRAQRDGISPEQLLIELRQLLADSAAQRGLSAREAIDERVRVIRVAIDSYYAG